MSTTYRHLRDHGDEHSEEAEERPNKGLHQTRARRQNGRALAGEAQRSADMRR